MAKHKIAYVDESPSDIRRFQRFAHNDFDIIPIIPDMPIEDICDKIIENHIDAIVSDFEFSDHLPTTHYNGSDLAKSFLKRKHGFPIFILTSFEDDAILKTDDVNIVYEKEVMSSNSKFLTKIQLQIEKYTHALKSKEEKILALLNKSTESELTALEIDELHSLDAEIEKSIDTESRIPNILRASKDAEKISELIKKVDELTAKLT